MESVKKSRFEMRLSNEDKACVFIRQHTFKEHSAFLYFCFSLTCPILFLFRLNNVIDLTQKVTELSCIL